MKSKSAFLLQPGWRRRQLEPGPVAAFAAAACGSIRGARWIEHESGHRISAVVTASEVVEGDHRPSIFGRAELEYRPHARGATPRRRPIERAGSVGDQV